MTALTPKSLEERARELVAEINGWKREDYERPRNEVIRMNGGAEFVLLTEAIVTALREVRHSALEDAAAYCEAWETEGKRLAAAIRALEDSHEGK